MGSQDDNGIVNVPSTRGVAATIDRLDSIARGKGMTIFARIDQRAAAATAGLTMRPTELLLFGNPAAGTILMKEVPSIAIDLPLRALAWEDADGKVWLSYNSPDYLQQRHGLTDEQKTKIAGIVGLVAATAAA